MEDENKKSATNLEEVDSREYFKASVNFFELKVVRWTVAIFAVLIIVISALILIVENRPMDISADGFKNLTVMLQVPLGLLAILTSLMALFATNHRSVQTNASMKLTRDAMAITTEQNRFSNHFKNLEEFENHAESKLSDKKFQDLEVNARLLYEILFPGSRSGKWSIGEDTKHEIAHAMHMLRVVFDPLVESCVDIPRNLFTMHEKLEAFQKYFKSAVKFKSDTKVEMIRLRLNGETKQFTGKSIQEFAHSYKHILEFYDLLLKFDTKYDSAQFENQFRLAEASLVGREHSGRIFTYESIFSADDINPPTSNTNLRR